MNHNNQFWSEEFLCQVLGIKESELDPDPIKEPLSVMAARFFQQNYQKPHTLDTVLHGMKIVQGDHEHIKANLAGILEGFLLNEVVARPRFVAEHDMFITTTEWHKRTLEIANHETNQVASSLIWFGIDVDNWKGILTGQTPAPRTDFGMYLILKILTEMSKLEGSWNISQLMAVVKIPVADSLKRQMVGFALENMTAESVLVNVHGKYTPWDNSLWYIDQKFQETILNGIDVVEPIETHLEASVLQGNANVLDVHIPTIRDVAVAGDRTLFRINGDWIFTQYEIQKAYSIMGLGPLAHSNEVTLVDVRGQSHNLTKAVVGALNTVIRQVWKGHDEVKIGVNVEQPAERSRQVFSTHPEFDELPETAMLDPRIRDLLEDAAHLGKKVTRVLTGQ